MRLSSLLPMLLLLASPLAAQPNCHIFDLTASAVQLDPASCQFFVVLNFQHDGTTNQFQVKGNGTNYGLFPYSQIPLTLGPLMASPNGPTTFEFVVQDAVFPDCQDETTLTVPACGGLSACEIFDLTVQTGDCHPNLGTYALTVDFQVSNPGSDFFEVFTGNGVSLGTFPLASLPLTLPNFPWGGGAFDVLKVCITDQPNCCKAIDFAAPTCFSPGCGIIDLSVIPGDCLSDSTYKAKVNFSFLSTIGILDSFKLYLNNELQGVYALNQLPLQTVFASSNNPNAVVKVCAVLATGELCCLEKAFTAPICLPPCAIQFLKVETDSCTTDSTFGIWVNFQVADPTAVDSFSLWGNGQFLGHFGMNQLPLHLDNFEWNGLIFNSIKVCTGNDPGCCKEARFLAPDCLPFGPCEITDIFAHVGPCTSDSTYKLTLNFNATNPGNGTFIVFGNGAPLDTFNLSEAPVLIQNFPWNGTATDVVTICIGSDSNVPPTVCCKSKEIVPPPCLSPCEIFDLSVEVGDCNPNGGYHVTINFGVQHPGNDFFEVWANGQLFGTYPLNQLPLHIPNFPASGNPIDFVKICINDQPNCCVAKEFQAPNCNPDCHIFDLVVEVGDCNPAGGYHVTINFGVNNPGNDFFEVWANGQLFGTYPLNQLPLHIPNFPGSGNAFDHIKICINDHPDCCIGKEFQAPNCNPDCHIFDLEVEVGDCNPAGGYHVTINFGVNNPGNDFFEVWANGQLFGTYPLNQLPLHIPNFPGSGAQIDVIKICINDQPDCCVVKEIHAPHCGPCEIFDLHVETGDCNPDSTYHLTLDFQVANSNATSFILFANGTFFGNYLLSQLPLHIPNFPWDGVGPNDFLKVCVGDNIGALTCCKTIEFPIPPCLHGGPCDIFNLHVETGVCTSDSSYVLKFDFDVQNPPANTFGVWANGQFLGMYGLGQLPIIIQNFPWNGGPNDVLKVCFSNAAGTNECCETIEFAVPDCLTNGNDCEIFDMVVDPGGCTSDSTYVLGINFQVQNPPSNTFGVWANGNFFGTYTLSQLPLVIQNFPWNGGNNDVVKVCFLTNNGATNCCKILEFEVPDCLTNGGDCEIFGMVVDPGDCSSDSTYSLFLNFQVQNPPGAVFGVWANGNTFLGTFNLNQLPLNFPNFPWNGGTHDAIKVCFLSAGSATCCKTLEFEVPDCLGNSNDCHIYDVLAVRTGCLCGQFFVAVTFQHDNGGNGGFDLVGNGNNYGTYPYNTQQPIILGPFPGDGTTVYEFGVVDHLHPDCEDGFVLGVVECSTPVVDPGGASSLVISPNPASNWLNVTAMLESGTDIGQATVKIYHADGRLIQTQMVMNAASFQLDVSNLPAGVYRLNILAGAGRLDGSFTKQ